MGGLSRGRDPPLGARERVERIRARPPGAALILLHGRLAPRGAAPRGEALIAGAAVRMAAWPERLCLERPKPALILPEAHRRAAFPLTRQQSGSRSGSAHFSGASWPHFLFAAAHRLCLAELRRQRRGGPGLFSDFKKNIPPSDFKKNIPPRIYAVNAAEAQVARPPSEGRSRFRSRPAGDPDARPAGADRGRALQRLRRRHARGAAAGAARHGLHHHLHRGAAHHRLRPLVQVPAARVHDHIK